MKDGMFVRETIPGSPVSERGKKSCGAETGPAAKAPRILIAAPLSGSGKTILTAALLALFKRRGKSCMSFKCGPDYIDPMFHRYVLGIPCRNLDSFFLPEEEVRTLFLNHAPINGISVIEGVMGYYDGVGGISLQASTYDIARITQTPVILVADGKKSGLSIAAQIKGFLEYRTDSRIRGIILNRTSVAMCERLRPEIERLGVTLFGAIPECVDAAWESRHLGLTLPAGQERLRERLERLVDRLEECLDIEGICRLAESAGELAVSGGPEMPVHGAESGQSPRRMGVARDEAFCFYYQENLEFLKNNGWELIEFSPLKDPHLPEALDAILLGGGYPECYAGQLSENVSMLEDIRAAAAAGVKILAECGGFLYLHRSLEGTDGKHYPMAGIIDGEAFQTGRSARFGYVELTENGHEENRRGIRGHEFHYWDSTAPGAAMKAKKPMSERSWDCIHKTQTLLAGFPHLYYLSAPEWILSFLNGEDFT